MGAELIKCIDPNEGEALRRGELGIPPRTGVRPEGHSSPPTHTPSNMGGGGGVWRLLPPPVPPPIKGLWYTKAHACPDSAIRDPGLGDKVGPLLKTRASI